VNPGRVGTWALSSESRPRPAAEETLAALHGRPQDRHVIARNTPRWLLGPGSVLRPAGTVSGMNEARRWPAGERYLECEPSSGDSECEPDPFVGPEVMRVAGCRVFLEQLELAGWVQPGRAHAPGQAEDEFLGRLSVQACVRAEPVVVLVPAFDQGARS
jgi:hypothetical protein